MPHPRSLTWSQPRPIGFCGSRGDPILRIGRGVQNSPVLSSPGYGHSLVMRG